MTATVSTAEAAQLLRVSPDTVLRLIHRGELSGVRIGRLWRVRLDAIGLPR